MLADVEGREVELFPIGREVPVPTGAIDLLLADDEGRPTLVETKLARNPDIRRTVVGQILEYAAHVADWDLRKVEDVVTVYRHQTPPPASETGLALDAEFRSELEKNLKAAQLRLIIAVDEMLDPLTKTVAFLNEMSQFEIFVLRYRSRTYPNY